MSKGCREKELNVKVRAWGFGGAPGFSASEFEESGVIAVSLLITYNPKP